MGAPTNAAYVKKVLANSEPSTQGGIATSQLSRATFECHLFSTLPLIDAITIASDNPPYRN